MYSVEFLFRNNDSTDPFYRDNMIYGICSHCKLNSTCPKSEQMPIVNNMVSYVLKYHTEISNGFAIYPEHGGWEQQPFWFVKLLGSVRGLLAKLEREQHGSKQ